MKTTDDKPQGMPEWVWRARQATLPVKDHTATVKGR